MPHPSAIASKLLNVARPILGLGSLAIGAAILADDDRLQGSTFTWTGANPPCGRSRAALLVWRVMRPATRRACHLARKMCAPRPTATGPGRFRAWCDAWPPRARCDEFGDRAEWRPRRSRDPRAHSPAAAAVAPAHHAAEESHPPRPGLLASRSGWRRSGARRAGRPARHKSDDACSRAWPDPWDSDPSDEDQGREVLLHALRA
jgi:hypothetical protein